MQTCAAIEGFERVMPYDFIVGLGSNLGDRGGFLAQGVQRIAALPKLHLTALSRVYETEGLGPAQPRYLNAAVRVSTERNATELLRELLAIERALGRTRELRWGPRVLDLDILWGSVTISSPELTVPHAELWQRTFALAPLLDVAPELAAEYSERLAQLGGAPAQRGKLSLETGAEACQYVNGYIV